MIAVLLAMALIAAMDLLRGGLAPYGTWQQGHWARKALGETGKWGLGACTALILGLPWFAVLVAAGLFRLSTNIGYGRPMGLYFGNPAALGAGYEFVERIREKLGAGPRRVAATPLISLALCGVLWGLPGIVLVYWDRNALATLLAWAIAMPAGAWIAKHLGPLSGSLWQNDVDSWTAAGWWQVFRGFVAGLVIVVPTL